MNCGNEVASDLVEIARLQVIATQEVANEIK